MLGAYIFILGLILGSFFNVCIYRIPKGESIAFPPSHCTSCDNEIKWYDLIPVISYVVLRGRCRHCGQKISARYPIVELITGILYLGIYIEYGISINTIKYIVLVSMLIIIGMIDFDTTDVYDSTIITGAAAGVIFAIAAWVLKTDVLSLVFGALLGSGVIALIIILTKGMGWGDAEICFIGGLFLGFKLTIVMMFLSFIIGGVSGIILLLLKLKTRKDYIPFGPSIALAGIMTVFFGQYIINFYMGML